MDDAVHGPDQGPGWTLGRDDFIALFDRCYAPLVRFALKLTNDQAAASDIVQDVFLRLWEDRETVEIRVSAHAMLYTMVRNRALNLLRDREKFVGDLSVSEAASDRLETQADELSDLQKRLRYWIDNLPGRRREAFLLSRYHDLSHVEIAEIMGLSVRTVNTHILLALRSLRERLDAYRQEGASH